MIRGMVLREVFYLRDRHSWLKGRGYIVFNSESIIMKMKKKKDFGQFDVAYTTIYCRRVYEGSKIRALFLC